MHISTGNISKMVTDMANITIDIKYCIACWLRLAYLELNLAYYKSELGLWNGVSPNIFTFLLIHYKLMDEGKYTIAWRTPIFLYC